MLNVGMGVIDHIDFSGRSCDVADADTDVIDVSGDERGGHGHSQENGWGHLGWEHRSEFYPSRLSATRRRITQLRAEHDLAQLIFI